MASQSIRFLHASGFQLHAVVQGLHEAPEFLLELLVHAPYRAAEQVIQTALREEVDFVILSGDLLDAASGGPQGVAFLLKQFEILHDNHIPVFWAASKLDLSSDWLKYVELPASVHLFSRESAEQKTVVVQDQPSVIVHGRSWNPQRPLRRPSSFRSPQMPCMLPCCMEPAIWTAPQATRSRIGARVERAAHRQLPWANKFCIVRGRLKACCRVKRVRTGCTLVHIDPAGEVRMRKIETDVVRWADERVTVTEGASLADVRNVLRLRAQKLLSDAARHVIVKWTLCGEAWFDNLLMDQGNRDDTLAWLRQEFGQGTQTAWSVSLEIEPPARFRDEWTDEDSILGDYLRTVKEFMDEEHGDAKERPLTLDTSAAFRQLPSELAEAMSLTEPSIRTSVLRESGLLGVDLLRGDERPADVKQRALEANLAEREE